MSNDIANKLAWVSKRVYKLKADTAKSVLKPLKTRQEVSVILGELIENISNSLGVLPNSLKQDDKDISAMLRRIRTSSNSILQALNDKACGPISAKKMISPLHNDLISVNKVIKAGLMDRVISAQGQVGVSLDNIELEVEKAVMAADKPKITLNSFDELKNYNDFLDDMRKKLSMVDSGIDRDEGVKDTGAIIDPEKADSYSQSLEKPVENFQFREGIYDQRANENAMNTQHALLEVQKSVPRSVTIDKSGYKVIKAPILAITQHYIADSVLKKSSVKFIRMPGGFGAGYTPGISPKSGGGESSYIIFLNQLVLAFPAKLLKEPDELKSLRQQAVRAFENRTGKLSIVRFGSGMSRVRDRELTLDQPQTKIVKNEENAYDHAIDKREYFSNRAYPGIIFMWLMPSDRFASLNNIRYLNINIAASSGLKPGLDSQSPDPKAIENRTKKEQEDYQSRINNLAKAKQQKEKLTKPLFDKLEKLVIEKNKAESSVADIMPHYENAKTVLDANTAQLALLVPGSKPYKAMLAARTTLQLAFDHFKSEIDGLKKDVIPTLEKERKELKAEIDKMVAEFIAKRKLKRK